MWRLELSNRPKKETKSLHHSVNLVLLSINTKQKFIAHFNLADVYTKRNPDIPGFTLVQQHSSVAERIDMFLVSKDISHDICDISVTPAAFSDHSSIMMSIQGSKSKSKATKGQAYWKFNTSFLQEERFRIQIIARKNTGLNQLWNGGIVESLR